MTKCKGCKAEINLNSKGYCYWCVQGQIQEEERLKREVLHSLDCEVENVKDGIYNYDQLEVLHKFLESGWDEV